MDILGNMGGETPKVWWQTLLDSGSDGDLLFVSKRALKHIQHDERMEPETWQSSTGTFKTTHVGNLEVMFPAFSRSKIFKIKPDIVIIDDNDEGPMFELILGIDTLCKFGCILDFSAKTVEIDGTSIAMRPLKDLRHKLNLSNFSREYLELISTREATKRTIEILDANYQKANLPEVIRETCGHLSSADQSKLLRLLKQYEELFDGTLGDFQTEPVKLNLKPGATPYHGRPYPIPQSQLAVFKNEVERLCEIGVLERQEESEWGSPTFIIPKKNQTVRFLTDFRKVNRLLVRTPFPIPKISSILQQMEGFTHATALDLNMGY